AGAAAAAPPEEAAERAAERRATVVCAEDQLSLAIGRSGQNVRLASKLTGYKIDLVSKQEYLAKEEEILFGRKPEAAEAAGTEAISDAAAGGEDFALSQVPGVTPEAVAVLSAAGYHTFEDIINLERQDLLGIAGIDDATVDVLMRMIDELTVEVDEEWDEETGEYVESASEDEPRADEGESAGEVQSAMGELQALASDENEGSEARPDDEAARRDGGDDEQSAG
ncbi:MAG TPA: helix-hairpin-helix domain-containing protein, partial [Gemmatimonadota bacterium]|nr:helix-hairpin-helix domain-containing protein [Gemmatimonadota bacterium]